MHFSIDRTIHTTAFDKPVVDHWLERKIAQTAAGSTEKDRSDDRPLQRRARYRLSRKVSSLEITTLVGCAVLMVGCGWRRPPCPDGSIGTGWRECRDVGRDRLLSLNSTMNAARDICSYRQPPPFDYLSN